MGEFKDPSQNFLEEYENPITHFFLPKTIALIGATEKNPSVARTILNNLIHQGYQGKIFPINPKYSQLFELPCYPDIESIDEAIDLAIIVTPAKTVPGLVKSCVKQKIPAIIIISAGFKEAGPEGVALEQAILGSIKGSKTRIIGPNCLGLMNPHIGLNATFSSDLASKGNIAFLSQSGAMCTSVLDWSLKENVGFSAFVSIGSMADVQFADLIQYFGNDPHTDMILIYMETVGDARLFLAHAKKVAMTKPIVLIKAGRTQAAKKAAASHTGSLAGSDDAFDAAVKRVGVFRVDHIEELFDMTLVLSKQPLPLGPNLTIITNAGGPAVLATDGAILSGAKMTEIDSHTIAKLSEFLPQAWSHSNPVDLLGDADHLAYAQALKVVAQDPNTDGILVILTPQDMTKPVETAESLSQLAKIGKPILASYMGGDKLTEGIKILNQSGIPNFAYPDEAAKIFGQLFSHQQELIALYETPAIRDEDFDPKTIQTRIEAVEKILNQAREENRAILTEFESKQLLKAYDIPIVETLICETVEEAMESAERLGFPVVVKLHSDTITHKSDVGGVQLNLKDRESVAIAYQTIYQNVKNHHSAKDFLGVTVQPMITLKGTEVLLGSFVDEQFGPIILFGTGGVLVEIFKDRALSIPPLNATLARQMIEKTKIGKALEGVRGKKSIDFTQLETIMINFSKLIVEHPSLIECDINPLLASSEQIIALDARFVIALNPNQIVKSAIRPYPTEYIQTAQLRDGSSILIRPISPEDEPKIISFHHELSENSVRRRFFEFVSIKERIEHERLIQICAIDYQNEMRFVAVDEEKNIVGVIAYQLLSNTLNADFKLVIIDKWHNKGLGTLLLNHLIQTAKKEGVHLISGSILDENTTLLSICKKLGFTLSPSKKNKKIVQAKLRLIE